jgi:hypothetical protein
MAPMSILILVVTLILSLSKPPRQSATPISGPHVPMSHPIVERLIGSIRRELLDHTFFWTATHLENKLRDYQCYYNKYRA